MLQTFLSLSGLIASIWIIFGVFIAAKFYPNYSHSTQFCSELGAKGSPTEKLSPLLNNYPLGILFSVFGWYVYSLDDSVMLSLAGVMIIIHGIGTFIAGYFPMDADPYTKNPSFECKVHSWAGMFVLFSLLLAPIFVVFSDLKSSYQIAFNIFSVASVVVSIWFLMVMTKAFKNRKNAGLYQRLAYGVQLLWLAIFSATLFVNQ